MARARIGIDIQAFPIIGTSPHGMPGLLRQAPVSCDRLAIESAGAPAPHESKHR